MATGDSTGGGAVPPVPGTAPKTGSSLGGLMEEMGYACTSSDAAFAEVLDAYGSPVDEAAVAEVMGMVARTHSGLEDPSGTQATLAAALGASALADGPKGQKTWDVNVIVDGLKKKSPGLDWNQVVASLDHEGLLVPDQQAFTLILAFYKRGAVDSAPFPLAAVCGRMWANSAGQLSFLRHAVAAPPEVFSFERCPRKLAPIEGLHADKSGFGTPNCAWVCLDLLETLCCLAEAGHVSAVRPLLDSPASTCPEVLALGLASVTTPWGGNVLQSEALDRLVPPYLLGHPNSGPLLHRLWEVNRDAVVRPMVAVYDADPSSVSRLLDVCQELKGLPDVLASTSPPFCIDLAALAGRREYLNLDKWFRERVLVDPPAGGLPFLGATIKFLGAKLQAENGGDGAAQAAPKPALEVEALAVFARVAASYVPALPPEMQVEAKAMLDSAYSLHPQLGQLVAEAAQGPSPPPLPGGAPDSFPRDVEAEANAFFQSVYEGRRSVEDAVAVLRRYKASADQREQVVFACAVHNLFDEYRFYSSYPDKELHVTAVLFGSLVRHQLVTSISLGVALRYVLDAARQPPGSKMFAFAATSLRQFRQDLGQWPQYCSQLAALPALRETDPGLAEELDKLVRDAQGSVPGTVQGNGLARGSASGSIDAATGGAVAEGVVSKLLTASLGSNDAPEELKDLKEAFDAAPQSEQAAGGNVTGAPDMPPLSQSIAAAFAAPPTAADKAADGGPAGPSGATPQKGGGAHLLGGMSTGSQSSAAGLPQVAPQTVAPGLHFSVINAETLESAAHAVDFPLPPESLIDKVHFLINNLSTLNLEEKAKDVATLVQADHFLWFANYMVVKRAAQEPNFHTLYIDLMDKIADKRLLDAMVRTTHKYVRVLLRSDGIKTVMSDRSLLKNLGSWLGKLTIKRNKPVLQKDLDVKGIVYQAYEEGKMIAVIPFVHKVLEPCAVSRIFKPPNPWLMAIVSLLAEIYSLENLKLNLKFEIELLFKVLDLPIGSVKPSDTLSSHKREQGPSNPDFSAPAKALLREALGVGAAAAVAGPDGQPPPPGVPPPPSDESKPGEGAPAGPPAAAAFEGLLANLHMYVQVSPSLGVYADKLKRVVPVAVDRAICDIITPVVERSVTIACCTTKELVLKDFVLEPDEQRMRKAAHMMVSSLAGSLALVTCKEPLRLSVSNQLRQLLAQCGLPPDQQLIEQAVQQLTADNLELGCTIIEKAATDKAIREIDERLLPAYQARAKAKQMGQAFVDVSVLQGGRFPSGLPESLRPKPGGQQSNPHQQRVYEDFQRILRTPTPQQARPFPPAGVAPPSQPAPPPEGPTPAAGAGPAAGPGSDASARAAAAGALFAGEPPQVAVVLEQRYALWQQQLEATAAKDAAMYSSPPEGSKLAQLAAGVAELAGVGSNPEATALGLARKVLARMQAAPMSRLLLAALASSLEALRDGACRKLPGELTAWFVGQDDAKLNKEIAEALLRSRLLHLPELDTALAKGVSANRGGATELAIHLAQQCCAAEPLLTATELYATLDVLSRVAIRSSQAALVQLVEQARAASARLRPGSKLAGRPPPAAKPVDPPGLRERVVQLLDEWARLVDDNPGDKVQAGFVGQLQAAGFLKGDDTTDRVLRILVELAVSHCLSSEGAGAGMPGGVGGQQQQRGPLGGAISFVAVDALARLLVCLVTSHGGGVQLLQKVLSIAVGVLQRDAEERAGLFNGRPYFRLLAALLTELSPSDPADEAGLAYLLALAGALHQLQPIRAPGFAFAWLELVGHRQLMPVLLLAPAHKGWPLFQRLLVALLRFLEPYLRNADLTDAVRLLYKGTLRVLLVLLHDFPEFLCEYHFQLCGVVPPSCIQMRNLILSAFPRSMRLPDPFTPNLKVDLLPEINLAPRFVLEPDLVLPKGLRQELDSYLKTRQPPSLLQGLKQRLVLPQHEALLCGTAYNVPLLNTLVFYVGIQAIQQQQQTKPGSTPAVIHGPAMDVFQRLASELDSEGRYLLLNAVANQLRYPNLHTHYFSCVLLYLFGEAQNEAVQEQITRVLLERLIVNRPHPWGLLITFIELIKNPRYNFWSHGFTRCAPEIERLFESVARSCMGPPQAKEDGDMAMQQPEPVRG